SLTHRPSRTSSGGTPASSASIGSASRASGSSLLSARPTTTPTTLRLPKGTTRTEPPPTSSIASGRRQSKGPETLRVVSSGSTLAMDISSILGSGTAGTLHSARMASTRRISLLAVGTAAVALTALPALASATVYCVPNNSVDGSCQTPEATVDDALS